MSLTAALVLVLAAGASTAPADNAGPMSASARASVVILRPVIVRQDGSLQANADVPSHQVARTGAVVRYEFQ